MPTPAPFFNPYANDGTGGSGGGGGGGAVVMENVAIQREGTALDALLFATLALALASPYEDGDVFLLAPGDHVADAETVTKRVAFAPWNKEPLSARIIAGAGKAFTGWGVASVGSVFYQLQIQTPTGGDFYDSDAGADVEFRECEFLGSNSTTDDTIGGNAGTVRITNCIATAGGGTTGSAVSLSGSAVLKINGLHVIDGTWQYPLELTSPGDFEVNRFYVDDAVSSTYGVDLNSNVALVGSDWRIHGQSVAIYLGTGSTDVEIDGFDVARCTQGVFTSDTGAGVRLHLSDSNMTAAQTGLTPTWFDNADFKLEVSAAKHKLTDKAKRLKGYYDTVAGAIAAAVDGDRIGCAPGDIAEEITLNKAITLYPLEGPHSTRFVGSVTGSHRIYVTAAGCEIHDIEIMNPPSAPFNGLLCSLAGAADSLILVGVRFYGPGGGNSVGALVTGGGPTLKDCYWMEGGFSNGLEIRGATSFGLIDGVKYLAGTYAVGVYIHTGASLKAESLTILETCTTTDGLRLGAAKVVLEGARIEDCSGAGLHIIADGLDLEATNLKLLKNTGDDILVDPLLTGAGTKIEVLRSTLDASKINAPVGWAEAVKPVGEFFEDPPAGSQRNKTFKRWGADESTGAPWHNSESVAGYGQSSDANAQILRKTAAGVFDSITADFKAGISSAIFSDTAIGAEVYFGFPWLFNNIKARWTVVSSPGFDAHSAASPLALATWEAWDGVAWYRIEPMWRMADPDASGKKKSSGTLGAQAIQAQHLHFNGEGGWKDNVETAVNGVSMFWVRARLISVLTTSPQLNLCKWGLSRVEQDGNGLETYGNAQSNAILIKGWNRTSLGENTNATLTSTSIDIGLNPVHPTGGSNDKILAINNTFAGNRLDGVIGTFTLPWDIDTSNPLHLDLNVYSTSVGNATANFTFTLYAANEGDIMGSLVGVSTQIVAPITDILNARTLVHVDLNFNRFAVPAKAETVFYIAIHRDGVTNVGNNLVIADSHMHYYSWRR